MSPFRPALARCARLLAGAALCCNAALAQAADNHALILWIGEYGADPGNDLPGVDIDGSLARQMAQRMGVPASNIRELSNASLTRNSLVSAFADIERRLGANDSLLLYFSGHGARSTNPDTGRCSEALVLRGMELFTDAELEQVLQRIGSRARQVVMFNDSCFSGGAAEKSAAPGAKAAVPKQPKPGTRLTVSGRPVSADPCSVPINAFLRNFSPRPDNAKRPNFVYLAAAANNEVAFATPNGSAATVAWSQCMTTLAADGDKSGAITAQELNACAQAELRRVNFNQTVTLSGKGDLPLIFPGGSTTVVPSEMFGDIWAGRDESIRVTMTMGPRRDSYRIGQDRFRLQVTLDRAGYLYVYQAGSDGTISPLFPFEGSADSNRLPAGTHVLPPDRRYSYRSDGPAGVSHFIAVLTPENVDVLKQLRPRTQPTGDLTRNFSQQVEQTGAARWGASGVLSAREVQ